MFRIPQPALSLVLTCITKLHPKSVFPVLHAVPNALPLLVCSVLKDYSKIRMGPASSSVLMDSFQTLIPGFVTPAQLGAPDVGPSLQECFECSSNYHFIQIFTCMPSCASSFFFDHTTHTCLRKINLTLACHSECASCFGTSSDSCSSCAIGRTL